MRNVTQQALVNLLSWCPVMQSCLYNSYEDQAPVDESMGAWPSHELQRLDLKIGHHDSNLSNGHQVTCYFTLANRMHWDQNSGYKIIALASHMCTCVLHRQLCYLHTLKLPKFFNFHGDFHQKWHFAHPEFSFAHPELPFLAKSMYKIQIVLSSTQQVIIIWHLIKLMGPWKKDITPLLRHWSYTCSFLALTHQNSVSIWKTHLHFLDCEYLTFLHDWPWISRWI